MKRSQSGKIREIMIKTRIAMAGSKELAEQLQSFGTIEHHLDHMTKKMPQSVRTLPFLRPLRQSIFEFKDLVRQMRRTRKTLAKHIENAVKIAETYPAKPINFEKLNSTLNAELKIIGRMKKDAIEFNRRADAMGKEIKEALALYEKHKAKTK
ncbi:MAG TPA: hypothetical protein VIW95_05695 [Candidatus Binatus sp.]|uniref:hypothetical protein n=1 Tax=Candidatus Binatus sp. TaxID=2811406 RepID=UPI002F43009E